MDNREQEFKNALTGQTFEENENHERLLDEAKKNARSLVAMTEGIAVLSDFSKKNCHTFSGKFGQRVFGLPDYSLYENSPFEDEIFRGIIKEDMLERHVLELRFFNFIKTIALEQKPDYQMACIIRFIQHDERLLPVLHTSRYIQCHGNGSVWLGLCTYIPLPCEDLNVKRGIINCVTGETIKKDKYSESDTKLLSKRQIEILSLLAKGEGSKQIAEKLFISVHTVNRHRQDILAALKVTNTAQAVEIGLRMHLI